MQRVHSLQLRRWACAHMIEFSFPNSRAHFSYKLLRWVSFCPDGSQLAQMGLILPRILVSNSALYSAVTRPFQGYLRTQKNQTPPQNITFPGLNWKVGKMNYHMGKLRPQLGNMFEKVGKTFL